MFCTLMCVVPPLVYSNIESVNHYTYPQCLWYLTFSSHFMKYPPIFILLGHDYRYRDSVQCVIKCLKCPGKYCVTSLLQYTEWNEHDKKLQGYIETKAKPLIFYLPKEHTPQTEELVTKTREKIEGLSVCPSSYVWFTTIHVNRWCGVLLWIELKSIYNVNHIRQSPPQSDALRVFWTRLYK